MKFRISRAACIGNGRCVDAAPEVFALDHFNKAIIIHPEEADEDKNMDAAQACPVQAVIVESDAGERIYPLID
ncbi:MAG TPA: ferredoxin [Chloroflexota bacterium]|nr:ferredoxin [Chloroflexota bacterium]